MKFFKNFTKLQEFHLLFQNADLQDIIYTILTNDFTVNIDMSLWYVPLLILDAETQKMFTVSIRKSFTVLFDPYATDTKTIVTQLEYRGDISSAQNTKSPDYLKVAHQTAARIRVPNKTNIIAIFDNLNVRKYFVDIDGVRNPRDGGTFDYASNDYFDRYRDPNFFSKEYVGEELLSLS